ncbi:MAG: hypothetical protein Kow0069_15200 [Promethearchaeota archaeon]
MVVGIVVYRFELNPSEDGDIEPRFAPLHVSVAKEGAGDVDLLSAVNQDDLYALFFHHTTGAEPFLGPSEGRRATLLTSRLKKSPFRTISHFHRHGEEQYLVVGFFKLEEDPETFEAVFEELGANLAPELERHATGTAVDQVEKVLAKETSHALYLVSRLENLTKLQMVALLFASPERVRALEVLRQGPVSRKELHFELEAVKAAPNVEFVMKPFFDLGLARRDWARGARDRRTGRLVGEGEHFFLVKDVALVRVPPRTALERTPGGREVKRLYEAAVADFFRDYDPVPNLVEESSALAKVLLDPDAFDLLALLAARPYPFDKLPADMKLKGKGGPFERLLGAGLVAVVDDGGTKWACLLAEVEPLVVFPKYLVSRVLDRASASFATSHPLVGGDRAAGGPITQEVADRALQLLQQTHDEELAF